MTQYIDKAALVAEIKRRISLFKKEKKTEKWSAGASQMNVVSLGARIAMLEEILSFIDTLEAKDNDLVEEIDYEDYIRFFKEHPDYIDGSWGFEETWTFAQYCYELGLKAQKGE